MNRTIFPTRSQSEIRHFRSVRVQPASTVKPATRRTKRAAWPWVGLLCLRSRLRRLLRDSGTLEYRVGVWRYKFLIRALVFAGILQVYVHEDVIFRGEKLGEFARD